MSPRPPRRTWSLHPLGLTCGVALAALSCAPTLVPRTGFSQGLVAGVMLAAGHLLGVVLARVGRPLVRRRPSDTTRALGWVLLAMLLGPVVVLALHSGYRGQVEQAALLGVRAPTAADWLLAVPVAVAVLAVLVAIVRGVRALPRWPRRGVLGLVTVIVVLALVSVAGIPGVNPARTVLDRAFAGQNDGVFGGATPPTSPLRSGSPASLLSWDSLGRGGRTFVSSGPSPAALAAASGRPAVEPIRVYVGLGSSADAGERARLAVAELRRTGAFDRPVVAVLTTTGTGFVDAEAVDALELAWGGDTAVVASQYSLMPSALSLLLDGDRVAAAGTTMYDAVRAAVDALPAGQPRPRVVVFGESLGALGSQAAFGSVDQVRDGALWNGPPNSSTLWRSLVAGRDPGTREVRPVVGNGRQVRFGGGSATPGLVTTPPAPWPAPRTVYLQHPSDPVVWWTPCLLWERPDWLAEPRGDDVLPTVRWVPLVTFWQVTMDMIRAQEVPFGHGHNYGPESLDAWMDVVPPPGWTPADTARAHAVQEAGGLPTPGA
ncbi:alpha/beta hydrolase [Actinomycetospora chiangmaiensis]|uniref:alpha/beta hydrolase n=1 Tax=Actinomycetospora chiangmaiensis TaxID=402650 RepID=UPI00037134DB|nr:alpha/beta hydrolase [Actinomycetospora chiangmaiensis]